MYINSLDAHAANNNARNRSQPSHPVYGGLLQALHNYSIVYISFRYVRLHTHRTCAAHLARAHVRKCKLGGK